MNLAGFISNLTVSAAKEQNLLSVERSEIPSSSPQNSFEDHLSSAMKDTSKQENLNSSSADNMNKKEDVQIKEDNIHSDAKNNSEINTEKKSSKDDTRVTAGKPEEKTPEPSADLASLLVQHLSAAKTPAAEIPAKKIKTENNQNSNAVFESHTAKTENGKEPKPLAELHILNALKRANRELIPAIKIRRK